MHSILNTKAFAIIYFAAYVLFFAISFNVTDVFPNGLLGHTAYGFPFTYYYAHCFGAQFIWLGLLGNVVIGAVLSVVVSAALTRLWYNVNSPEFRAKRYL
jgi:hypothetical protein